MYRERMPKRARPPNSASVWAALNRCREKLELEVFDASKGLCDWVLLAGRKKSGGHGHDFLMCGEGPASKLLFDNPHIPPFWKGSVTETREGFVPEKQGKKTSAAIDLSAIDIPSLLAELEMGRYAVHFSPDNEDRISLKELIEWDYNEILPMRIKKSDISRLRTAVKTKISKGQTRGKNHAGPAVKQDTGDKVDVSAGIGMEQGAAPSGSKG